MATREEVLEFLKLWKLACHTFIDFVPREKNMESLSEIGITKNQAKEIIKNLKLENYVEGPKPDKDLKNQEVWMFGLEMEGRQIYIKVKAYQCKNVWNAKCISFHFAEWPLRFPYAGGDQK